MGLQLTESGSVPADEVDMETKENGGREPKHGRDEIAEDDLKLIPRTAV